MLHLCKPADAEKQANNYIAEECVSEGYDTHAPAIMYRNTSDESEGKRINEVMGLMVEPNVMSSRPTSTTRTR